MKRTALLAVSVVALSLVSGCGSAAHPSVAPKPTATRTAPAPLTAAQERYVSDMRHEFNVGSSGLIGLGKDICTAARLQGGKQDGLTQVVTDDGFGSNPAAVVHAAEKDLCPRYLPKPPPQSIEPVSTRICHKLQTAWSPYSSSGGGQTLTNAEGLALGNRIMHWAQTIPSAEIDVSTSQTPDLASSLEIEAQDMMLAAHGSQASGLTQLASVIATDCGTLGVSNPNVWGN